MPGTQSKQLSEQCEFVVGEEYGFETSNTGQQSSARFEVMSIEQVSDELRVNTVVVKSGCIKWKATHGTMESTDFSAGSSWFFLASDGSIGTWDRNAPKLHAVSKEVRVERVKLLIRYLAERHNVQDVDQFVDSLYVGLFEKMNLDIPKVQ